MELKRGINIQSHLDKLFTSSDFKIIRGGPTARDWMPKHRVSKSFDRDNLALHYSGPFGKAAILKEMLVTAYGGVDAR